MDPNMPLIITALDWICVVLFILGFIGNLLGLVVFSSRRFHCCPTYATLALASFAVNLICIVRYSLLLHSTTRRWLSDHVVCLHWLTCKIYRLSSSFRVLSAWITVFWVIERFLYASSRLHSFHQHEYFQIIEKHKCFLMICVSLIMIIIVTGPTVIFFAPNLTNNPLNTSRSSLQCTFNTHRTPLSWQRYFDDLAFGFNYNTIRFLFSELIPSILVALFNIAILICVLRTTAHVRKRQECLRNNQFPMLMMSRMTSKFAPLHIYDTSQQRLSSARYYSFKSSTTPTINVPFGKISWMNIILILHSLLFFLSSSLTSLIYFSTSDMILAYGISVIILANCSLNFYIYCLSGRQFRTELKRITRRYKRNIEKIILRRCYRHNNRHHLTTQNGKDLMYQAIPQ